MSDSTPPAAAMTSFRRFATPFLSFAILFSTLAGTLLPVQIALSRLTARDLAPQVVMVSLVRSIGPATSLTAAILALVVWSHGLDAETVARARRRTVVGAMVTATLVAPLTTALSMLVSAIIFHFAYHLSWSVIGGAVSTIRPSDIESVGTTLGVDAGVVTIAIMLALPALARTTWPLRRKVVISWLVAIALRSLADVALTFVRRS